MTPEPDHALLASPMTRRSSLLLGVLLTLSAAYGCASSPSAPAEDASAVEGQTPSETNTRTSPHGALFDDVAANADLFAADTRILAVVRSEPTVDPTWIDVLVGVAPAESKSSAPAALREAPLSDIRRDLHALFHRRLGLVPSPDARGLVIAAGPQSGTLVVQGPLDYDEKPTPVEVDGYELLQIDVPQMSYGPLWAIELQEQDRTAIFLTQRQALEVARALDREQPYGLATDEARLKSFQRQLGNHDGYLGVMALTESGALKEVLEKVLFEPLGIRAKPPERFAISAGSDLEIRFFDTRAKLGAIERDVRQRLARVDERTNRMMKRQLDQLPLAVAPLILAVTAVIQQKVTEVETVLTTESLTYRIPIDPVESRRALLGIVALHMPPLAAVDHPDDQTQVARRVQSLARGLRSHLRRKRTDGPQPCVFPAMTAIPADSADCCSDGGKTNPPVCAESFEAWNLDWYSPGGSLWEGPQHFRYRVESNGKAGAAARAIVIAETDYDCDGRASQSLRIEVQATVDEDGVCKAEIGPLQQRNVLD